MPIDYKVAKEKLSRACDDYISHSDKQLKQLQVTFNWGEDVGRDTPGLDNWLKWHFKALHDKQRLFMGLFYMETDNAYVELVGDHHPGKIIDSSEGIGEPKEVLKLFDNYIANLNGFLKYPKETAERFELIQKEIGYNENNFKYHEEDPLSTKLYLTLQHVNALVAIWDKLAEYNAKINKDKFYKYDSSCIEFFPVKFKNLPERVMQVVRCTGCTKGTLEQLKALNKGFDGYLKRVVVKELSDTLKTSEKTDQEQLKSFENLLNLKPTQQILLKDRQSKTEKILKLLSTISTLIGVGIFPTLGMAFKRLYDTGGRSANFLQPRSTELSESATSILKSVAPKQKSP